MQTDHELWSPLRFRGGAESKNRMALAALTNRQSHDDGTLSDAEHEWLVRRARGGFGLITTCAAYVSQEGKAWGGQLGVSRDEHTPGLRRLAASFAEHGALGLVQLFHGGLRADPSVSGQPRLSASASDAEPTRGAASAADLTRWIDDFAAAAARVEKAGLAGVELHGAHGYLLGQFLSTVENQRTDAWAGDLEGRARLLREVTRAVRRATSSSFIVGVRLSPEDFGQARGVDLDENLQVTRWLAEDGIDFLHLSLWDVTRTTQKRPGEHAVPLFKSVLPSDVAVLAAGKVWTRSEAETLRGLGADVVALGRAAILNPDWPILVAREGAEPARAPMRADELHARSVSPAFVQYLHNFKLVAP